VSAEDFPTLRNMRLYLAAATATPAPVPTSAVLVADFEAAETIGEGIECGFDLGTQRTSQGASG
jgi:hypothetical protein